MNKGVPFLWNTMYIRTQPTFSMCFTSKKYCSRFWR